MSFPVGVNFGGFDSLQTSWFSPDVWATAINDNLGGNNYLYYNQTKLAATYVSGSKVLQVENPDVFSNGQRPGTQQTIQGSLCTSGGNCSFNGVVSVGSPYVRITSWNKPSFEQNYDAGTLVDNGSYWQWSNGGGLPSPPEYVDASGRYTGYPNGLGSGQRITLGIPESYQYPTGYYTLIADGNGSVNFTTKNLYTGQTGKVQTVTVTSGISSNQVVVPPSNIFAGYSTVVTSSMAGDPLRNVRLVMDGFADTYMKNRNNVDFFMFHPTLTDRLKPFSVIRYMDTFGINNSTVEEWTDVPQDKGMNFGIHTGKPLTKWLTQLGVEINADQWFCVYPQWSKEAVRKFAKQLYQDRIVRYPDSKTRIIIERGNEQWNWGFMQAYYDCYMSVIQHTPYAVQGMTSERGVVTVTHSGHPYKTGSVLHFENSTNDSLNRTKSIIVIDGNTYYYNVDGNSDNTSPSSRKHHTIMALDTASPHCSVIDSIVWDGYSSVTIRTTTPHKCGWQDIVQIGNVSDPGFNQAWSVNQVIDANTIQVTLGGSAFNRSTPKPVPTLTVSGTPKDGNPMRMWRVGYGRGPAAPDLPTCYWGLQYHAEDSADITSIFHEEFGSDADKLVFVLAWQVPGSLPNQYGNYQAMLNYYKSRLGGSFLPQSEVSIACAPYFTSNLNCPVYKTFNNHKNISAIQCSGNQAVVSSAGHGFGSGDWAGIYNIQPSQYCGQVQVQPIDANNYSYTLPVSGLPNGSVYDGGIGQMFATRSQPYVREITSVSISGNVMTCGSYNHGYQEGDEVYICNGWRDQYPMPLYSLFNVHVVDSGNFSVTFDNTQYYHMPPGRSWAYLARAIDDQLLTYNPVTSILPVMDAMHACAQANPPVTVRCYESGFGDTCWGFVGKFPFWLDILIRTTQSPGMGEIYKQYFTNATVVRKALCVNHYSDMGINSVYGMWGLMNRPTDPYSERWLALASLSEKVNPPSGEWVLGASPFPIFAFRDNNVAPESVNITVSNSVTTSGVPGSTSFSWPYATFTPSGTVPVGGSFHFSCTANSPYGVSMPPNQLTYNMLNGPVVIPHRVVQH